MAVKLWKLYPCFQKKIFQELAFGEYSKDYTEVFTVYKKRKSTPYGVLFLTYKVEDKMKKMKTVTCNVRITKSCFRKNKYFVSEILNTAVSNIH